MRIRRIAIFISASVFFLFLPLRCFAAEAHRLFTDILKTCVNNGSVNYTALSKDKRLQVYLQQLAATDPTDLISRNARLAFWLNAYNAYTLKVICDEYPVKSINNLHTGGALIGRFIKGTVWDKDVVVVNHKKCTLNDIAHKILDGEFKEPRIHFALVCASRGSPPLRSEAYEEAKLDEQLDEQGRIFLRDAQKNSFNAGKRIARISPVFEWDKDVFGGNKRSLLLFLVKYLVPTTANNIIDNINKWKVEYSYFDWSLND